MKSTHESVSVPHVWGAWGWGGWGFARAYRNGPSPDQNLAWPHITGGLAGIIWTPHGHRWHEIRWYYVYSWQRCTSHVYDYGFYKVDWRMTSRGLIKKHFPFFFCSTLGILFQMRSILRFRPRFHDRGNWLTLYRAIQKIFGGGGMTWALHIKVACIFSRTRFFSC